MDTSGLPVVTEVVKHKTYEQTQLSIKADKQYALNFDNRDPGVSHSMVIYDDDDFPLDTSAHVLFSFDPFPGASNRTFVIPPLNKGKYLFQCAVHDNDAGHHLRGDQVAAPRPRQLHDPGPSTPVRSRARC